jgi:predicted phage terminase large subunit-like protein
VRRTLGARTKVNDGGRILATSAQEALLIVLREKALAGDARSLDRLLDEARRYNDQTSASAKGPLPEDDQAILDAYVAEVVAAGDIPTRSKKKLASLNEHTALAALLRCELPFFVRKVFNTLLPGTPYYHNDYLDLMGDRLTQVHKGEIRRLVLNVPPRSLKTIYASIAFPAWVLGRKPSCHIIFATYSLERAAEVHRQLRAVIDSAWFQELFPGTRAAKQTETEFITTAGGGMLFTSVGGPLTGYGADLEIIDDPTKAEGPGAEVARKRANKWFSGSAITRLNDQKTGAIIIVQQRLHWRDLSGHVLPRGGWEHVNLPLIAPNDIAVPFGAGKVFKRHKNELLHPERMGWEEINRLKRDMDPADFAAQFLQAPAPAGIVLRSWFKFYQLPFTRRDGDRVVQSWDTARTVSDNSDFSVCTTWLIRDGNYYVLNVFRAQLREEDLPSTIAELATKYRPESILIEDFGCGADLLKKLRCDPPRGLPEPIGRRPLGFKPDRMKAQAHHIADGHVHLPVQADWLADFLDEVENFPDGRHDDQVDSMSQFLGYTAQLNDGLDLNFELVSVRGGNSIGHRLGKPGW